MSLNIKLLSEFGRLYLARKKLKAKYDELGKKLEKMEGPLLDHMMDQGYGGEDGVNQISLKGGRTFRIDTKIWAKVKAESDKEKRRFVEALKKMGLQHTTTPEGFNHQSLSAYLRELSRDKVELPEELKPYLEPNPVDHIIVQKH